MLTFHGNNLRTGWQQAETALTPSAVAADGMARIWTSPALDGDLYGQPLFVQGVMIGGQPRDVVYVATENDSLWALDAHTGAAIWGPVTFGTPAPASSLACGDINPVGVTGTPVIDPAKGAIYAVGLTDAAGTLGYELVAADLATGALLPGYPVPIAPPGLDPTVQEQRGALTLLPGGNVLDVPFGGYYGDCGDYHGWVQQIWLPQPADQASYVTPTRREGGLWATGGLAYGPEGALYGVTGNSDGASASDMGDAVIRLLPTPHLHQPAGAAGFFAPTNAVALDLADEDFGSAGPLLLPPQPGPYPLLLFAMGKQGIGYLVDRYVPGGVGGQLASQCMYGSCGRQEAVFSTAAYYAASNGGQYILTAGRTAQAAPCTGTGGLEAWRLTTGDALPSLSLAWCGPSMSDPGSPTVSSDGTSGPVAWVLDTVGPRLLAVDGATGQLLWESPAGGLPSVHRFTVPTVADGMVLVPETRGVTAYALR